MIEWDQDREPESMAAWLLKRTGWVPGAAEALVLQCVQEAIADGDQDGIARWDNVLDTIEDLRGRMPAAGERVH
jgi:hypothetical protein